MTGCELRLGRLRIGGSVAAAVVVVTAGGEQCRSSHGRPTDSAATNRDIRRVLPDGDELGRPNSAFGDPNKLRPSATRDMGSGATAPNLRVPSRLSAQEARPAQSSVDAPAPPICDSLRSRSSPLAATRPPRAPRAGRRVTRSHPRPPGDDADGRRDARRASASWPGSSASTATVRCRRRAGRADRVAGRRLRAGRSCWATRAGSAPSSRPVPTTRSHGLVRRRHSCTSRGVLRARPFTEATPIVLLEGQGASTRCEVAIQGGDVYVALVTATSSATRGHHYSRLPSPERREHDRGAARCGTGRRPRRGGERPAAARPLGHHATIAAGAGGVHVAWQHAANSGDNTVDNHDRRAPPGFSAAAAFTEPVDVDTVAAPARAPTR